MQILNSTGLDWLAKRLISKPYTEKSPEVCLDQEDPRSARLEEELHKDAVCHRLYLTYTADRFRRYSFQSTTVYRVLALRVARINLSLLSINYSTYV